MKPPAQAEHWVLVADEHVSVPTHCAISGHDAQRCPKNSAVDWYVPAGHAAQLKANVGGSAEAATRPHATDGAQGVDSHCHELNA